MKQIPLTRGFFALVDDEDFEELNKHKWNVLQSGKCNYAVRMIGIENGKQTSVRMHRIILDIKESHILCDHIDGNGLNNQKSNLRRCNKSENACNRGLDKNNTSGYKGVSWDKSTSKWLAYVKKDGKFKNIGRFESKEVAAKARDAFAKLIHGEFAKTNF